MQQVALYVGQFQISSFKFQIVNSPQERDAPGLSLRWSHLRSAGREAGAFQEYMSMDDPLSDEELQQHSHIVQDYVKHIYLLQQEQGVATTVALAERLQKEPPSITAMLQKLAKLKLIEYTRYQGATLTTLGEKVALAVIRHHR